MVRLSVVLILFSGCAVEESDFPDAFASTYCDRVWHCDIETAQDIYGSMGDCEDFWSLASEAYLDLSDFFGEEYSPNGGGDCIRTIRWTDCEDIEDIDLDECDSLMKENE